MKNKYVVMGMVIIIAVAAIWGVYEVYNSIMFRNSGEVVSNEPNSIIKFIKNIGDKNLRRQQIELYLERNRITQEEANILY